jgi:hypothetical protein
MIYGWVGWSPACLRWVKKTPIAALSNVWIGVSQRLDIFNKATGSAGSQRTANKEPIVKSMYPNEIHQARAKASPLVGAVDGFCCWASETTDVTIRVRNGMTKGKSQFQASLTLSALKTCAPKLTQSNSRKAAAAPMPHRRASRFCASLIVILMG